MKEIAAFVCEFCPKRRPYKVKSSAKRHEKRCYRNPETHSCATCGNFGWEEDIHDYLEGGEHVQIVGKAPYCEVGLITEGQMTTKCPQWIPIQIEATA